MEDPEDFGFKKVGDSIYRRGGVTSFFKNGKWSSRSKNGTTVRDSSFKSSLEKLMFTLRYKKEDSEMMIKNFMVSIDSIEDDIEEVNKIWNERPGCPGWRNFRLTHGGLYKDEKINELIANSTTIVNAACSLDIDENCSDGISKMLDERCKTKKEEIEI